MTTWSRRLAIFLGASLLVPLTTEFVLSQIKKESYDYSLAFSLILIVGPVALLLYYAKPVRMTARLIMSLGLMVSGLATTMLGLAVISYSHVFEDAPDAIGITTVVIGLLVASIGALYFGRERYDLPQELPSPDRPADPTEVKVERFSPYFRSATHTPVIDRIMNAMSTDDLHYVAYYVEGNCIMTLDLLEHPDLARFHEVVEPYQRRDEYKRHGTTLESVLQRLNQEFRPLNSGDLIRLVFDVERGAIYYYVVTTDSNRFLVAATLNQYKVYVADMKVARIVDEIRVHLGQPRMTELELPPR